MRVIKLSLISIVILFIVITLISALIPSQVRISRVIDLDASRERVYPFLAQISAWEGWNEYARSFTHPRFQVDTLNADDIRIIITGKCDSLITANWQQPLGRSFESGYYLLSTDSNHTTLQWYFNFHLRWYPWEKFQGIIYDQQLGPPMERSLQNLQKQLAQFP